MSVEAVHQQAVRFATQAIVDSQGQLFGMELLWRDADGRLPDGKADPDQMTAAVLTGLASTRQRFDRRTTMWVNASPALLHGELAIPWDPQMTVIELHESVYGTPELASYCRRLHHLGYRLALDDFLWQPGVEVLLSIADYVKLDLELLPGRSLEHHVRSCRQWGVDLVAERVETQLQMDLSRQLGFDLFQGFLVGRPDPVVG